VKRAVRTKLRLLKEAQERDTTRCIFCGASNVTREHVFSQWTHKHLNPPKPGRTERRMAIRYFDRMEIVNYKLPGAMRDWQIKCVCGGDKNTCNNGWMRELEEAVEPILTPIILGEEIRLFEADHKLIATWAVLKVMVMDHRILHHMQRKYMKARGRPPGGWAIWIGNFDGGGHPMEEEWLSRPFSVLRDHVYAKRRSPDGQLNSVATTILIKKMLIHVAYSPKHPTIEEWRFSAPPSLPFSGHLAKIWPPLGHSTTWPKRALSHKDAENIANTFLFVAMKISSGLGRLKPLPSA
jgi:hypothetical protein